MPRKRIETDDSKFESRINDCKSICKTCGHRVVMSVSTESVVCNYCGNLIKNNSKEHFKYKLKQLM